MDANIVALMLGIIAAIPGTIALLRQWQKDKRREPIEEIAEGVKVSREAAEIISQYSTEIRAVRAELSRQQTEIDDMYRRLAEQDKTLNEWRAGIERLLGQITSLGQAPVWKPKTGPLGEKR